MSINIQGTAFKEIIEQFNHAILIHKNLVPIYANNAFMSLIGHKDVEFNLNIEDISQFYLPECQEALQQHYSDSLACDEIQNKKFQINTLDNKKRWLNLHTRRILINEQWCLCDTLIDISEQIQTEKHNKMLAAVVELMDDGVEITDHNVCIEYVNPAYERMSGYHAKEIIGKTPRELFQPKPIDRTEFDRFEKQVKKNLYGRTTFSSYRKDGSQWFSDTSVIALKEKDGQAKRFLALRRDVTKQIEMKEALMRSERRQRDLMQQAADAIFVHDSTGKFIMVNTQACINLGYTEAELLTLSVQDIESNITGELLNELWQKLLSGSQRLEGSHTRKDGSKFPVELCISIFDSCNEQLFLAIARDITERKENEKLLHHQANFDNLTNLPNRKSGTEYLQNTLTSVKQRGGSGAIFFIDLDNFKKVNDTIGHYAGDALLTQFSKRLRQCLHHSDMVARLGGDEFMVVINNAEHLTVIDHKIQQVLSCCIKPYQIESMEIFVGLSVGIALFPKDGDESGVLMRNADAAMYRAKSKGHSQFSFYDPVINEQAVRYINVETELRRALDREELHLVYQPIIERSSRKVIAAEALLRWSNPLLGDISPTEFIPIAEQTGLIRDVGFWVLKMACQHAKSWQSQADQDISVWVNISATQLRNPLFLEQIKTCLAMSKLMPEFLELELTEGVLLAHSETVKRSIDEIKGLGVRLSIDDFGTGYSSLSSLLNYPFDTLKIDKSFIDGVTGNKRKADMIKAVGSMAKGLDLMVVAEGVETKEQEEYLSNYPCDYLQGWLFSKPLAFDDFIRYLHEYQDDSS